MPRKRDTRRSGNSTKNNGSWINQLKWGESYTSLLLGIIAVVILALIIASFARTRNIAGLFQPRQEVTSDRTVNQNAIKPTDQKIAFNHQLTGQPTIVITIEPTKAPIVQPTKQPTPTVKPTSAVMAQKPTDQPSPTKEVTPTVKPKETATPTSQPNTNETQNKSGDKTYTVVAGDTLWGISEKMYKTGYSWSLIAKANNLTNPGLISSGTKLTIPAAESKNGTKQIAQTNSNTQIKPTPSIAPSSNTQNQQQAPNQAKIVGNSYTVQRGDYLWEIAIRAYDDGYRWVEIARANNLVNPDIIHSGNVLKLPR